MREFNDVKKIRNFLFISSVAALEEVELLYTVVSDSAVAV
jgi:hypothetical protein